MSSFPSSILYTFQESVTGPTMTAAEVLPSMEDYKWSGKRG